MTRRGSYKSSIDKQFHCNSFMWCPNSADIRTTVNMLAPLKQTFLVPSTTKSAVIVGLDGAISVSGGMVQAWVGHFVTPLKRR
jgi:hypothetical protein